MVALIGSHFIFEPHFGYIWLYMCTGWKHSFLCVWRCDFITVFILSWGFLAECFLLAHSDELYVSQRVIPSRVCSSAVTASIRFSFYSWLMAPYGSLSRLVSYYPAHTLFFTTQTPNYLFTFLVGLRYFWFLSCGVNMLWRLCHFDDCNHKLWCVYAYTSVTY